MRAAIYARFSSDLQSQRSIDDQVALCRQFAERQGFAVADVYPDYAVSGATIHGRFAFERLVQDARAGRFEVILAEDLDRLSRNQADIAGLYERMTFAGVEIWTVADGRISEMHVGLKGTMSALFLKNLALKTHRGLQGRVRAGKSAGGRCFGYRVVRTGEREIDPGEADTVRRIFEDYASGLAPREIAARLNREGVAGPRGGEWNASTINGSVKRANGILHNELYIGRLVWNRQRFIKDPDTGKRVSRPNASAARQVTDVPHLRIIDEDLWSRVQAEVSRRTSGSKTMLRKPRHLLSGLCRCGTCGGSFIVAAPNQLGCSTRREKGTCGNRRMIAISLIEDRILEALETQLLHPKAVERFVQSYVAERKALRAATEARRAQRSRRLGEIDREETRIFDIFQKQDLSDAQHRQFGERLKVLAAERAELDAQEPPEPEVIAFHPALAARYRDLAIDLRRTLDRTDAEARAAPIEKIRNLIERVVIYARDDEAGRDLELHGTITALLNQEQGRYSMATLVAGTGFVRTHTHPATIVIPVRSKKA